MQTVNDPFLRGVWQAIREDDKCRHWDEHSNTCNLIEGILTPCACLEAAKADLKRADETFEASREDG